MRYLSIIPLLLLGCGPYKETKPKAIPDAETAILSPWFYLGEWRYYDTTKKFVWANMAFTWDSTGSIEMTRTRLLNDGTTRVRKSDRHDTLDHLRDKITKVSEDQLRYRHKSIDVIFTRYTNRVEVPYYFKNKACSTTMVGTCEWYSQCVEKSLSCGNQGYPLGYGYKYCKKFSAYTGFSAEGNKWRDQTLKCLQHELKLTVELTLRTNKNSCADVRTIAFRTHPDCYTREPHSVCYIKYDMFKVLEITKDEMFTTEYGVQAKESATICLKLWKDKLDKAIQSKNEYEIDKTQIEVDFWKNLQIEATL